MQIPAGAEGRFAAFLGGDDSAAEGLGPVANLAGESPATTQQQPTTRPRFVNRFGASRIWSLSSASEIRGGDIASLVKFGSGIAGAKFICLGDYANSRGAADMGLVSRPAARLSRGTADAGKFHEEWGGVPQTPGLTLPEMVESARSGKLKAFYVVGANPVGTLRD